MEKEFFKFLRSGGIIKTFRYDDNKEVIVNKVKYNDKLELLYSQDNYTNDYDMNIPFKYAGIYDREKDTLYNPEYTILTHILNWDYYDDKNISSSDLYGMLENDTNDKIKELVNETKKDIFNINNVEIPEELTEEDVEKDFIFNKTSETLEDEYRKYSSTKSKDILDYLTDKESFVEREGRKFVVDNISEILKDVVISNKKRELLKQIEDNPNHLYHKKREIINAIIENNCYTVNVTIEKDNKQQTFKYNANTLKNNYSSSYLSSYDIENRSDREKFHSEFGYSADFYYDDIVKITYGKKTLYEDNNFKEITAENELQQ